MRQIGRKRFTSKPWHPEAKSNQVLMPNHPFVVNFWSKRTIKSIFEQRFKNVLTKVLGDVM